MPGCPKEQKKEKKKEKGNPVDTHAVLSPGPWSERHAVLMPEQPLLISCPDVLSLTIVKIKSSPVQSPDAAILVHEMSKWKICATGCLTLEWHVGDYYTYLGVGMQDDLSDEGIDEL